MTNNWKLSWLSSEIIIPGGDDASVGKICRCLVTFQRNGGSIWVMIMVMADYGDDNTKMCIT
jgi:hypothetical protein